MITKLKRKQRWLGLLGIWRSNPILFTASRSAACNDCGLVWLTINWEGYWRNRWTALVSLPNRLREHYFRNIEQKDWITWLHLTPITTPSSYLDSFHVWTVWSFFPLVLCRKAVSKSVCRQQRLSEEYRWGCGISNVCLTGILIGWHLNISTNPHFHRTADLSQVKTSEG